MHLRCERPQRFVPTQPLDRGTLRSHSDARYASLPWADLPCTCGAKGPNVSCRRNPSIEGHSDHTATLATRACPGPTRDAPAVRKARGLMADASAHRQHVQDALEMPQS